MEFNCFGINSAGKRSLGATRGKNPLAALCGYRIITTCTSSVLLIALYNIFFPQTGIVIFNCSFSYKSMQTSDVFCWTAPTQRMLRLYTAFKVLFIQLTLNFKAFYWDNRIYSVRSSLEITAWNAHPGEVMQKMKHIWQNKTMVGVTRQSQGKGQWGELQTGKGSLVLLGEKRVKLRGKWRVKTHLARLRLKCVNNPISPCPPLLSEKVILCRNIFLSLCLCFYFGLYLAEFCLGAIVSFPNCSIS